MNANVNTNTNVLSVNPETVYAYGTHRNIPWNFLQYQPLKEYLDPGKEIAKNKEKNVPYVTKRGFYMDQHIKVVKPLPSPDKYLFKSNFDQTENAKQGKNNPIMLKVKKNSYIDQIEREIKNHKSPSVGQYTLDMMKKAAKKKKKVTIGDKRYFYEDKEHLSVSVPGSFAYYPHQEVPHIHKDRTDHKFWIGKHKKQSQSDRKRSAKQPAPGTYRPISVENTTFDRIELISTKQKKQKTSRSSFGSDPKFPYQRVKKVKIVETRPDPCAYTTAIEWKGKSNAEQKAKGWSRCLSAGPKGSVYH